MSWQLCNNVLHHVCTCMYIAQIKINTADNIDTCSFQTQILQWCIDPNIGIALEALYVTYGGNEWDSTSDLCNLSCCHELFSNAYWLQAYLLTWYGPFQRVISLWEDESTNSKKQQVPLSLDNASMTISYFTGSYQKRSSYIIIERSEDLNWFYCDNRVLMSF